MKRRTLLVLTLFMGDCSSVVGHSEGIAVSEKKDYASEAALFKKGIFKNDPLKNDAVFDFVNNVQKRYYIIRRLEAAVERLLLRYKSLCEPCSNRGYGCSHRGCLHRGCSLEQELFRVSTYWKDFLSYKYIMNDTHTRELLVHLIVLYDALLKVSGAVAPESGLDKELFLEHGRAALLDVRTLLSCCTLDDLLDVVDILSAQSRKLPTLNPSLASQLLFSEADLAAAEVDVAGVVPTGVVLEESVLVNAEPDEKTLNYLAEPDQQGEFLINTTIRFYMIQRLNASLAPLAKLALGRDASRICAQLLSAHVPSTDDFQSPVMRDCLKKMHTEGSLAPLFVVWESVGSYRYIGDNNLIRELLLVAIQVYRLFMKVVAPKQEQDAVPVAEALSLYSTISSLPLTDLFFLIDEFVQQANSVADAYQQGAAQGWNVTLKQYWWVPPVVVAGCISLYMRVKQYVGHVQYRHGQLRLLDVEGVPMRR